MIIAQLHTADPATAIHQQFGHSTGVVNLDALPFGDIEPGIGQADPFMLGAHDQAWRPVPHIAAAHAGDAKCRFHRHAFPVHPEHRVLRVGHQNVRQFRIGAARRDAHQVGQVLRFGIRVDAGIEVLEPLFDLRQQRRDLRRIVEREAQDGAAPVSVAAAHRLWCLLQSHHALRAILARGHRGSECGIAGTDDDDVIVGHQFPPAARVRASAMVSIALWWWRAGARMGAHAASPELRETSCSRS